MQLRKLGMNGPLASPQGLGCMGMSIAYGKPDDEESIATIHRALDLGINLVVTSDAYGNGKNEELVGRALKGRRGTALVATKFGNLRLAGIHVAGGSERRPPRLRAPGVREVAPASGRRRDRSLRPPPRRSGGADRGDGWRHETSRRAGEGAVSGPVGSRSGYHPPRLQGASDRALETEYSLWSRDVEKEILPVCRELGIGFMAYAPLGRGFLTATIKTLDTLLPTDRRRDQPRFSPENIKRNAELLAPIEKIAAARKCTAAQVALAWLQAQGEDIVPIPGTKRRGYLEQNVAALDIRLTAEETASLSAAFPLDVTSGTRYPEAQMKGLGI